MSVWAHHMFTDRDELVSPNSFFRDYDHGGGRADGNQIFKWLGTMWGGKIQFKTPMLFCIAFLFSFLIAGLTGIMLGRRRSTGS